MVQWVLCPTQLICPGIFQNAPSTAMLFQEATARLALGSIGLKAAGRTDAWEHGHRV
jgi:hypothetical protein